MGIDNVDCFFYQILLKIIIDYIWKLKGSSLWRSFDCQRIMQQLREWKSETENLNLVAIKIECKIK